MRLLRIGLATLLISGLAAVGLRVSAPSRAAATTDYTQYVNAYQGGQVYMKYPLGRIGLWSTSSGEIADNVTRGLRLYPTVDQVAFKDASDWRSSVSASPSQTNITYGSATAAKGSTVAMTVTPNVDLFQYHFNNPTTFGAVEMQVQEVEGGGPSWTNSSWQQIDSQTAQVHLNDGGPTHNFYYYIHFSAPATGFGTYASRGSTAGANSISGDGIGGYFRFAPGTDVTVAVALSMASAARAQQNYTNEAAGLAFTTAVSNLRNAWNAKLSKVDVQSASTLTTQKTYTALYSAYANIFDVTDNSIGYTPVAPSSRLLTTGSSPGWEYIFGYLRTSFDQGRDFYALMTLLDPAVMTDLLNTYIAQYNHDGYLFGNWDPFSNGSWADQQWGYFDHYFLRAKLMGVTGVDYQKAETAILATEGEAASQRYLNQVHFYQYGYIPADLSSNYMSRGMEMSTHLNGLAHLAALNGDTATYNTYMPMSKDYLKTFNPANQEFQGRCTAAGVSPCDANNWAPVDGGFFEGNHQSYAFDEPQDGIGLAQLYGDGAMVSAMTAEFGSCGNGCAYGWNDYAEYEPYMAAAANDAALAQQIIRTQFLPAFNSLNIWEDAGGGTPFYTDNAASCLLGVLGIFPLQSPASQWMLNSPEVTTAVVHGTQDLTISAPNNSSTNIYVNSLQVNGSAYPSHYISGETLIVQPTTVTFGMTSTPSRIGRMYVTGSDGEIRSATTDNSTYLQFNNDPVGGTSRARLYSALAPISVSLNGSVLPASDISYNISEGVLDLSGLGAGTVLVSFSSGGTTTTTSSSSTSTTSTTVATTTTTAPTTTSTTRPTTTTSSSSTSTTSTTRPTTTSTGPTTTTTVPSTGVTFMQANAKTANGKSLTISYSAGVKAGNFLVAIFRSKAGGASSVRDNLNGAWVNAPVSDSRLSIWYIPNARAGSTTVTMTSRSGSLRAVIAEYRGVASNPFDSSACQSATGPAVSTGSTAAVSAGELVFAGVTSSANPNTVSAGSSDGVAASLRAQVTSVDGTIAAEDVLSSAAGGQNAFMTINGTVSVGWSACVATFKAAATPPPATTTTSPPPTTTTTSPPPTTTTTSPPRAPIAFVQGNALTGNGTVLAVPYSAAVRSGDFLAALVRVNAGATVTVGDNLNGAWTQAPVSNAYDSIWYLPSAKAGSTTLTVTAGSSGQVRASIAEYSGVGASSPFLSGVCSAGSGAAVTTGNTASTVPGALVFAGLSTSSNPNTVTAGASEGVPATMRNQATGVNGTIAVEDVTASGSGVQNATMTLTGTLSMGWNACAVAFKAAPLIAAGATRGEARGAELGLLCGLVVLVALGGLVRFRNRAGSAA